MNEKLKARVEEVTAGTRLDAFLAASFPRISRTAFKKLILDGNVSIDGAACREPRRKLEAAAEIAVELPVVDDDGPPAPEDISLETIFEDEHILVLNKQPGIVVHPGDGTPSGTVVNALLRRFADSETFKGFEDATRPGIVHRLDKDTSGCLLIAKTPAVLDAMRDAFKRRMVEKTYLAVVLGRTEVGGVLRNRVARHPVNRRKMAVSETDGKTAVSRYERIAVGECDGTPVSLVEIDLETGRTHQIRVQMSAIAHPVAGDALYGGAGKVDAARQMLHAFRISFPHPESAERMTFEAPVPPDMREFIGRCFPPGAVSLRIVEG